MRPDKVTFDYELEGTEGVSHTDICFPGKGQSGRMLLIFQGQQEPIHVTEAKRETRGEERRGEERRERWGFPCK